MNSTMSVEIDMEQCNGCGICAEECPVEGALIMIRETE